MDKEIIEEKRNFLLHFCKGYQDYGHDMVEADNFEDVKFFLVGLCNRALALSLGFIDLTTSKFENYLAAIPLIRLMLDNAMTGYAFFMAGDTFEERLKLITHIRNGKEIRQFRLANKNTLMEKYIINEMNHEIQGIRPLYKKASSYIHYSGNLINASAQKKGNKMRMHVNNLSGIYTDEERFEFWEDMIGANIYMITVIAKWDDYIRETINPFIEKNINPFIEREIEANRETIERLLKEMNNQ